MGRLNWLNKPSGKSSKASDDLSVAFGFISTYDPTMTTVVPDEVTMVLDVPHLHEAVMHGRMSVNRRCRPIIASLRVAG